MSFRPKFYILPKHQRRGLLLLFLLGAFGHIVIYLIPYDKEYVPDFENPLVDYYTHQIDSIKKSNNSRGKDTLFPFNPNYITAFKAYQLQLPYELVKSIEENREQGDWLNNIYDFQQFTQLPDSTIKRISPFLKFPQWKKTYVSQPTASKKQLNFANEQELVKVYGVGPVLANRILNLRQQLGGFVTKDQLEDVWGLEDQTLVNLWNKFALDSLPTINKLDINTASIEELARLYYISYSEASNIVALRTRQGRIDSFTQLKELSGIDSITIRRIPIYLYIKKVAK